MKTTNYFQTLIEPAEDCKATSSTIPTEKGGKSTVATMQYNWLADHPYQYDSDEILFQVWATRKGVQPSEEEKMAWLAKGQPCFRASPLTKQYGWCVHSDEKGKIALVKSGSEEHLRLVSDEGVKKIKAMRNSRK